MECAPSTSAGRFDLRGDPLPLLGYLTSAGQVPSSFDRPCNPPPLLGYLTSAGRGLIAEAVQ